MIPKSANILSLALILAHMGCAYRDNPYDPTSPRFWSTSPSVELRLHEISHSKIMDGLGTDSLTIRPDIDLLFVAKAFDEEEIYGDLHTTCRLSRNGMTLWNHDIPETVTVVFFADTEWRGTLKDTTVEVRFPTAGLYELNVSSTNHKNLTTSKSLWLLCLPETIP